MYTTTNRCFLKFELLVVNLNLTRSKRFEFQHSMFTKEYFRAFLWFGWGRTKE